MRLIFAIAITTSIFATAIEVSAQQPLREMFDEIDKHRPRGRLLKQLFGGEEKPQQDTNKQDQQRPTPAQQNSPNRAQAPQRNQSPQRNDPRNNGRQSSQTQNRPQNANNGQRYDQNQRNDLKSQNPQTVRAASSVKTNKTEIEFGAALKPARDGNGMVVTQVKRNTPAAEAGFQTGDIITMIAGLEIAKQEELTDILSVLGQGDQIEVEYSRRGKSDKAYVQFGEPEASDTPQNSNGSGASTDSNRWDNSQAKQSTRRSSQGDYDPIEPPGGSNLNRPSARTPASPASSTDLRAPISVLSNLHQDSSPTQITHTHVTNEQDQNRQIVELEKVIKQQETIIETMQRQISQLRQQGSGNRQPTPANYRRRGR